MAEWATAAEVETITGAVVATADVSKAEFIIELFSDATPGSTSLSSKNLRLLKRAVAYQAAWMSEHPDVFTNLDVRDTSEDGVAFTQANVNAHLLAPLASRAISRLTWRRPNRSIRVQPALNRGLMLDFGGRDSAVADDSREWEQM